ncbi:MAG: isoprenylcysteine carboxylmethyltransferase family protein [Gaiellaceae bacterium]
MTLLIVAALFGPPWPARHALHIVGIALIGMGAAVMLWGGRVLGPALTPFPSPRGAHLERGPYRLVRHPIYGGVIVVVTGAALATRPLALAPALASIPFLLLKARYEEGLLAEADPSYGDYLSRVRRRFFPGLL